MKKINSVLKTRLLKLYALAQRGEGGERENAKTMLDKELKANSLVLSDLISQDKDRVFKLKIPNQFYENRLLYQLVYVINHETDLGAKRKVSGAYAYWVFNCKEHEYLQLKQMFEHYKSCLYEAMGDFYTAFISRQNLYPQGVYEEKKLTPEERAAKQRAAAMSTYIDKKPFVKTLSQDVLKP